MAGYKSMPLPNLGACLYCGVHAWHIVVSTTNPLHHVLKTWQPADRKLVVLTQQTPGRLHQSLPDASDGTRFRAPIGMTMKGMHSDACGCLQLHLRGGSAAVQSWLCSLIVAALCCAGSVRQRTLWLSGMSLLL